MESRAVECETILSHPSLRLFSYILFTFAREMFVIEVVKLLKESKRGWIDAGKEIGKVGRMDFCERIFLFATFLGATSSKCRISLPCLRAQFVYGAVQEAVKYTNIVRDTRR